MDFIYDGECPLCTSAARALRIRRAAGPLHLVNAREDKDHPLVREVNRRGLDLDAGMVVVYQNRFYHGPDALHLMGLLGSDSGWFNRINAFLFRFRPVAVVCYPALRGIRNLLIRIRGVFPLDNLDRKSRPIFQDVFGSDWDRLPPVMKKHYANRPFRSDRSTVEGRLTVKRSRPGWVLTPFFRLAGALTPWDGEEVPVTVDFVSTRRNDLFWLERTFRFPGRKPFLFRSAMKPAGGNEIVEFMRFGMGWRAAVTWTGEKVVLSHRGYVMRFMGALIPLPLGPLIGRIHAEETPLNDDAFSMRMDVRHPLYGHIYSYSGTFRITETA